MKNPPRCRLFACCSVLIASVGMARAELRTLTDVQGRSIQADVVEVHGDHLCAEYLLFATIDSVYVEGKKEGLRRKAYRTKLDNIEAKGRFDFRTETVSAFKTKYNGNIVSAKTGESSSRETLNGIWLRVYRGDELIYENALPDGLRKKETWPKD
ncbi:MAG: hypothetical protein NTU80_08220 [Verrucomicrobia bacterium]|nr:hypothetical protein [Verrucomicrobiota bacterium]